MKKKVYLIRNKDGLFFQGGDIVASDKSQYWGDRGHLFKTKAAARQFINESVQFLVVCIKTLPDNKTYVKRSLRNMIELAELKIDECEVHITKTHEPEGGVLSQDTISLFKEIDAPKDLVSAVEELWGDEDKTTK